MPYIQNNQIEPISIDDLQFTNSQNNLDNYQQIITPAPEDDSLNTSIISRKSVHKIQSFVHIDEIYNNNNDNQNNQSHMYVNQYIDLNDNNDETTTACGTYDKQYSQFPERESNQNNINECTNNIANEKINKKIFNKQNGGVFVSADLPCKDIQTQRNHKIQRNIVLIDCADQKQVIIRDIDINVSENKVNFLQVLKSVIERQISYYFLLEDEIIFYSYDKNRDVFIQVPFQKGEISLLGEESWQNSYEIQVRYNIVKQFKSETQIKAMQFQKQQDEKQKKQKELEMEKQIKEDQIVQEFLNSLFQKKPIKREKERTIEFAVENVNKWRNLQQSGYIHQGIKINLNLNQAAYLIEIRRKTLDEYHKQIKEGQKNNFNFQENKKKKIGVLRKFNQTIKKNKEQAIQQDDFKQSNDKQNYQFQNQQQQNVENQDNFANQFFGSLLSNNQQDYSNENEQKLKNSNYDEDYALQMQFDQYSDISMDQQQLEENEQFQEKYTKDQTENILENLENYDDSQMFDDLDFGFNNQQISFNQPQDDLQEMKLQSEYNITNNDIKNENVNLDYLQQNNMNSVQNQLSNKQGSNFFSSQNNDLYINNSFDIKNSFMNQSCNLNNSRNSQKRQQSKDFSLLKNSQYDDNWQPEIQMSSFELE